MPRGDNQHQFTCPVCTQRKETSEKCSHSGYCKACCQSTRVCARRCDACGNDYYRCRENGLSTGTARASRGCELCGKHQCGVTGSYNAYRCWCQECVGCHQKRQLNDFYGSGTTYRNFDHPCKQCHMSGAERAGCAHHPCCGAVATADSPAQDCCGRCRSCCDRNCSGVNPRYFEMPTQHTDDGGTVPKPVLSSRRQFQFNPLKRTIGLELEYSKVKSGKTVEEAVKNIGGAIVADGTAAFEINTPPMNGDVFVHAMAYLSEELIRARCKVSESVAMHVHVGCLDYEWADMRRLAMLYGRLESGIYSIIDPRRVIGSYSHPNGGRSILAALENPRTAKADLIQMVYGVMPGKGQSLWTGKHPGGGNAGRYWGMNIHSWMFRGTVEFRMHHGTSRWEKMVGFSMLLAAMCDGALSIPEREIINFPQGKEGLLKIAPTPWVRDWVKERWAYFAEKRKNKEEPIADF